MADGAGTTACVSNRCGASCCAGAKEDRDCREVFRQMRHTAASARAVAGRFDLPPNAYLWVPSPARPGYGTAMPISTER